MNQSCVSGNDFSGRLFIQARRSKHSFSHVRMSWTTQKLRKKYIDENLGENPKLSKRLMNFAEFAALKTKYGSLGSFVNVFKPCQKEGFQQLVVTDLCRRAGINILKDTALSSRICTKCFRKVCTYSKLFDLLLSEAINKPIHVESEEIVVTKRAVSYTPGKSPSRKSISCIFSVLDL